MLQTIVLNKIIPAGRRENRMDIHHLKIFVSVYKNKSFTRASEVLNISQPTISEHIKNLEHSLGCRLFDRLGRSIMATAEAEVLYPRALQILDDLEQIQNEVTAAGTGIKGNLLIGASTIPGTYILPRLAYTFKKQHPEVAFEILIEDSGRITDMVLQHDLLCGIVGAKIPSDKLDFTPVIEDELVLVATNRILKQKSITLDRLGAIPFLQRELGSGTRQTFARLLEKHSISLESFNIVATLGSTSAVKQAVKESLGASVISRIAVEEELNNKSLHEIQIRNLKMKRKFYLVRQKKRTLPPQYQAFCNHLKNT